MPNGKPHLDGHLSVGARRAPGHRRHQVHTQLSCHQTLGTTQLRDDGPDDDGETAPADSLQDPCKLAEL
jgi:hypothetical protein